MKKLGAALVLVCSLVGVGCGGADSAALEEDTTSVVLVEGSREAYGVLLLVNAPDTTYATLVAAGVSAKASESIAKHVKGAAWQGGPGKTPKLPVGQLQPTPGQPLASIAELDALPSVGPTALKKLLAYAKKIGDVPDYYVDEVPLTQAEVSSMIYLANKATLAALETDAGLTVKAAKHIVAARPIKMIEQLGAVAYVDTVAIELIREYAVAVNAPAFGAPGAGTPVQFYQMTVQSLPISAAIKKTAALGSTGDIGDPITLGRYSTAADALAAALADPGRSGRLGGDLLFQTTGQDWANGESVVLSPATASAAFTEFAQAVYGSDDPAASAKLGEPAKVVLDSMLKGLKSSDAKIYRLHWDNQDDTNVEGIAVIDTATGEMRVMSVFFPG